MRVIEDASPAAIGAAPIAARPRQAGRAGAPVPIVELVLRNGRVLRVAETTAPDALGRLAAALKA